ncbi:unnamed protein product, partial [Amoebophrya sp. A120]
EEAWRRGAKAAEGCAGGPWAGEKSRALPFVLLPSPILAMRVDASRGPPLPRWAGRGFLDRRRLRPQVCARARLGRNPSREDWDRRRGEMRRLPRGGVAGGCADENGGHIADVCGTGSTPRTTGISDDIAGRRRRSPRGFALLGALTSAAEAFASPG